LIVSLAWFEGSMVAAAVGNLCLLYAILRQLAAISRSLRDK
jgi:hypothetical protein